MKLDDLTPEQATRVVALALGACCLSPAAGAAVLAVAPVLVRELAKVLEQLAAVADLVELERALMASDAAVLAQTLDELEARRPPPAGDNPDGA